MQLTGDEAGFCSACARNLIFFTNLLEFQPELPNKGWNNTAGSCREPVRAGSTNFCPMTGESDSMCKCRNLAGGVVYILVCNSSERRIVLWSSDRRGDGEIYLCGRSRILNCGLWGRQFFFFALFSSVHFVVFNYQRSYKRHFPSPNCPFHNLSILL